MANVLNLTDLTGNDIPRSFAFDGDDILVQNWGGFVSTYLNGPGIDNKLSAKLAGGTASTYYHLDHLGTTTGTSNTSGTLSAYGTPDSFGNGGFEFTGREYDSFTELYYYRARMYDPQLGRFTSEDPIGFKGGDINLYNYLKASPLREVDPYGTFGLCKDLDGKIGPCPAPLWLQKALDDFACSIDGYNPWLTLELGGGVQFGPIGGSDGLVFGFNPLTGEFAGQTKLMSGAGGATGILASAGLQPGLSLGPYRSSPESSPAGELFVDAAAFGGGSGNLAYDGSFGGGIALGPQIGGGAAGGLRIGETTPLFTTNAYPNNPYLCKCGSK